MTTSQIVGLISQIAGAVFLFFGVMLAYYTAKEWKFMHLSTKISRVWLITWSLLAAVLLLTGDLKL